MLLFARPRVAVSLASRTVFCSELCIQLAGVWEVKGCACVIVCVWLCVSDAMRAGPVLDDLSESVTQTLYSKSQGLACVSFAVFDIAGLRSIAVVLQFTNGTAVTGPVSLSVLTTHYCFTSAAAILVDGHAYRTVVTVVNQCATPSVAASSGFMFDTTPPVMGRLYGDEIGLCAFSAAWQTPNDSYTGLHYVTAQVRADARRGSRPMNRCAER